MNVNLNQELEFNFENKIVLGVFLLTNFKLVSQVSHVAHGPGVFYRLEFHGVFVFSCIIPRPMSIGVTYVHRCNYYIKI